MYHLKRIIVPLMSVAVLVSGCSTASRSFSKGEEMESEGRYEEAMYNYADAYAKDPDASNYRLRFLTARETAAAGRFKAGNSLMNKKEYAAALNEFQAALALDPTKEVFRQHAAKAALLKDAHAAYHEGLEFEKSNKLKEANLAFARALEILPGNGEFSEALKRVSNRRNKKAEEHMLSLKSNKPITLKFKDTKLKDAFSIISRLSGINFVFDDAVKDQPVTIHLEKATFQQSVELLSEMFKLGRKVANETTMLIYPKTPEKIKQYENMQVRIFHLNYLDAKKALNMLRGVVQMRKIHVIEESNSLLLRETRDVAQVVERILEATDLPDPEVILDVEVIEVSDRNTQNLGLLLSNYNVQLGAFSPEGNLLANSLSSVTTSSSSTTTTTTTTNSDISNLIKAFGIKGYGGFVTVPNAQYNLGKTLAKGEVLSNPKIRVKNREKSKFTVGTRIPITTTSTTGTTGGYSVNVQYVDVGVKLQAEPVIQLNNEVSIKLTLEVSSMLSKDKVGSDGATTVVTIGTRNLETVLSLKDGETSIIGGLMQNTKSDSKTKIFLLGDIPLIGPLLSNTDTSKDKTELVLAITPRLVRGVTVPQSSYLAFDSGKEDEPTLVKSLAAFEEPQTPANTDGASVKADAATHTKAVGAPVQLPLPAQIPQPPLPNLPPALPEAAPLQLPTPPAPQEQTVNNAPAKQAAVAAETPNVAPPKNQRGILQLAAHGSATAGQQFGVDIKASGIPQFGKAEITISYDPRSLELVSVKGDALNSIDGASSAISSKNSAAEGRVTVVIDRGAATATLPDNISLARLFFNPLKKGQTGLNFNSVSANRADGSSIVVLPFSTAFEVR